LQLGIVESNHGYQLEDKVWLMREHGITKLLQEPSAPFGCGYLAHGRLQDVIVNLMQIEGIELRITWRELRWDDHIHNFFLGERAVVVSIGSKASAIFPNSTLR